jgi:hypothetical protein
MTRAPDREQHMLIVKPVSAWAAQAQKALDDIEATNGGPVAKLADAKSIAPQAFESLIEALVALEPATGQKVADELITLAGLVPVDQALGD